MSFRTLSEMLANQARFLPNRPALEGPGLAAPLTYTQLCRRVASLAERLQTLGVRKCDRVALVMDNGPSAVVAFLAAACSGVCAPLNAGYTRLELEFLLRDLGARVLLVENGEGAASASAAREMGLLVVEACTTGPSLAADADAGWDSIPLPECRPHDCALMLHTSGSTARPKLVPLTHENVCTSAANIVTSLQMSVDDRSLNVMPLFHIHSLVGAVLASLTAGGSVVCAPRFEERQFFTWLETYRPTCYTAVPAIHYAVAHRAETHPEIIRPTCLRFIRSCSSPLPRQLMARLETVFGVPVVEAYGMTEAAHQISVNPLPPARRKPGSVGLPAGVGVAVVDDDWNVLPPDTEGEIVISGSNVTSGYEGAPT